MTVQIVALTIFAAVFVIAEIRRTHIGIAMFAAAAAMGLLAGVPLDDIVGGYPIDILILLVGVTFFFGIAKSNGTIEQLVDRALVFARGRTGALPVAFFVLTGLISAMGSPLGGLVMAPIGMSVAHRRGIDPMLMALAIGTGLSAGGFAPTSLFGIVTWGTADSAGIELDPLVLFAVAIGVNLLLLGAAYLMFAVRGKRRPLPSDGNEAIDMAETGDPGRIAPLRTIHVITAFAVLGLLAVVVVLAVRDSRPDVGVLAFGFGAVLALIDPESGRTALKEIDWSTVLLVGGIITYVGVLQKIGAIDLLGDLASGPSAPIFAALVICAVSGLVSAFASTTGILAALVPLAIPLVQHGDLPGWALICALALCSSIVDISPFSTVGAALVATTVDPEARPRMTALLTRYGLTMVVVGPVVLVGVLVLPAMAL
ncbi:C4-dicarboxylate ABC transporter [Amycolatopsis sp. WAC 01376]|uniref:SLC13 family permease n=1 Tax=Amycolatopsis sp. WAC 01376 TaxID=2203195 RepID=UPI000F7AF42D|nr:SLC13 family permease [Amycolatopsis sp. WAC 01376]RSM59241.1 C4-dicarboxylate ABC transporter [Amycolatopsis sp. WAC 01376]